MDHQKSYSYSAWSIWFCLLCSLPLAWLYTWHDANTVNLLDGDARYYYYYLQSTFIDPALAGNDWLSSATPLSHHPAGLAILWLPFFLLGHLAAALFHYPLTGLSLPYQVAIAAAALCYGMLALVYLRRLLQQSSVRDSIIALILPLTYLGTTLLHYTLHESGMSHVYSFFLITAFMFHSKGYVSSRTPRHLYLAVLFFGLILLVRLNNVFVILTLLFWFSDFQQFRQFFQNLWRSRTLYKALAMFAAIIAIQPLVWLWKEDVLFVNRYAPYGFYWSKPALIDMLFGFNAGFFIYSPVCLVFLAGLAVTFSKTRFFFYSGLFFVAVLFYFFSAYSAYTYYDGIGIRVLVDYYAVFALFGAKLFQTLEANKTAFISLGILSSTLLFLNLVYAYQGSHSILLRSGMTFNQWKYIFLRTGKSYENCLGGCNDLMPYSKEPVSASLSADASASLPFDYARKDFGLMLAFDSIRFTAKRVCMKINLTRREAFMNASRNALVCSELQNSTGKQKAYSQFRLNETPATTCCQQQEYHYTTNMEGSFEAGDRLAVYLWNPNKQPFQIDTFSVNIYHYPY